MEKYSFYWKFSKNNKRQVIKSNKARKICRQNVCLWTPKMHTARLASTSIFHFAVDKENDSIIISMCMFHGIC